MIASRNEAKLQCVVLIPHALLDDPPISWEKLEQMFAEDLLGSIRAAIRNLQKEAGKLGMKPSEFLQREFDPVTPNMIVESGKGLKVALSNHKTEIDDQIENEE